jgi:hypothetical protein
VATGTSRSLLFFLTLVFPKSRQLEAVSRLVFFLVRMWLFVLAAGGIEATLVARLGCWSLHQDSSLSIKVNLGGQRLTHGYVRLQLLIWYS